MSNGDVQHDHIFGERKFIQKAPLHRQRKPRSDHKHERNIIVSQSLSTLATSTHVLHRVIHV